MCICVYLCVLVCICVYLCVRECVYVSALVDIHCECCLLFVYKALVGKLPNYLMSLLKLKSICHNTRSQRLISLEIPLTKTNIGKIAFKFFASHKWNTIQVELKLTKYLSVNQFKSLLDAKNVP